MFAEDPSNDEIPAEFHGIGIDWSICKCAESAAHTFRVCVGSVETSFKLHGTESLSVMERLNIFDKL